MDGGTLCQPTNQRTGNYTFIENFLKALSLYDKKNSYMVYTFCSSDYSFEPNITVKKLLPKIGWMRWRVDIEEMVSNNDLFLALNQVSPLFGTKKIISFCHGLSYYFYPNFYPKRDVIRLNNQLRDMVSRSDKIIVSSIKVKNELLSIVPKLKNIIILPFGIPFDIVRAKKNKGKEKILLALGYDQPIKNTKFIINSFNQLIKQKKYKDYKLNVISANKKEFLGKNIKIINNISREKIIDLYLSSSALLTASHYESFNFPVLEALAGSCPIVGLKSAIIPEMQRYIETVETKEDFVNKIEKTLTNPKKIDYDNLKKDFSWKNYIKKLIKIYDLA